VTGDSDMLHFSKSGGILGTGFSFLDEDVPLFRLTTSSLAEDDISKRVIWFLFRVQAVLQRTCIRLFHSFPFYALFWPSSLPLTFAPDRAYLYFPPSLPSSTTIALQSN
jgi:hypothetical protein